ncbi:MAG: FHA domain-containing serine/threonine-protein kinase [Cyanobacteria bacterium P01_H01_bin.35]
MIRLTLLDPQKNTPLKNWDFQSESIIKVGRSPDNNIVLSDSLVSRYHLELHKISKSQSGNIWRLVSQGTNGTFVNGVLMSQGIVSDGSLIQLARGGPIFKFQVQPEFAAKIPQQCCPRAGDNPTGNLFCIYCGKPIQVQRSIRQYQVLRILGQGGMGTTYLAWDRERHNLQVGTSPAAALVVLKEMNADMAQIRKAQELFEREARALKSLDHSGIPKFFDFFVEEDKKYLAMEMIHGQDLEKRIATQGPILPQQAIEWMIQTCQVLEYIHSQDPPLIHRDIKPANLLVRRRNNQIVVLDFGAVKEIGTPLGTRIGAEGYSAPEQDRGQPLTQSDLYAVGATLIFLLTGQSPMHFYDNRGNGYRFYIESVPTITPQLRGAIEQVTQPLPGDRYQTAPELAEALNSCL